MNKMIPSEEWSSLNKSIHTDESGNVEIDGTTKLNGGLESMHTYNLGDYSFSVFFERHSENSNQHIFFGYFTYDDGSNVPCMGSYTISNGKITGFHAIGYDSIYKWFEGGTLEEKAIATNP